MDNIEKALRYFRLQEDYTLNQLEAAYKSSQKIINVDFVNKTIIDEEKMRKEYYETLKINKLIPMYKTYIKERCLCGLDSNGKLNFWTYPVPPTNEDIAKIEDVYSLFDLNATQVTEKNSLVGQFINRVKTDYSYLEFSFSCSITSEEVKKRFIEFVKTLKDDYKEFFDKIQELIFGKEYNMSLDNISSIKDLFFTIFDEYQKYINGKQTNWYDEKLNQVKLIIEDFKGKENYRYLLDLYVTMMSYKNLNKKEAFEQLYNECLRLTVNSLEEKYKNEK